jgi:hypothetical protein
MLFDFNNAACQNLRSLHESVNAMRRFNDKVGQWFFMLLTSFTLPAAAADDASLQISVEGGAFNAKFKFFNAADGCPSYNDIPGASNFLGGVRASDKGSSKRLPLNTPIHVFLFKPRDTPGISAAGGATEIRRRALQLTLSGDASLRYITFNDHVPSWEASDNLSVAPGESCLAAKDSEPQPTTKPDSDNKTETPGTSNIANDAGTL